MMRRFCDGCGVQITNDYLVVTAILAGLNISDGDFHNWKCVTEWAMRDGKKAS